MGGPGKTPQEHRAKPAHDRARQAEMSHLEPDGAVRGPELPDDVLQGAMFLDVLPKPAPVRELTPPTTGTEGGGAGGGGADPYA